MNTQTDQSPRTTRLERRPDGELILVAGTFGSGKTLYTMRRVAKASRLVCWDPHLQFSAAGARSVETIRELAQLCSTRAPGQYAYNGPTDWPRDQRGKINGPHPFHLFCRIARLWFHLAPGVCVIEELADVVGSGKPPREWGELIRWNRKLGGTIYAITQRPQETDKSSFRGAARIVCHAMHSEADRRYMASEMSCEVDHVARLNKDRLEHLERAPDHTLIRGSTKRPSTPR